MCTRIWIGELVNLSSNSRNSRHLFSLLDCFPAQQRLLLDKALGIPRLTVMLVPDSRLQSAHL